MKTCTKCGETKQFSWFSKNSGAKDGLQHCCKACNKIVAAAFKAANLDKSRDAARVRMAMWRAKNPEKEKAIKAMYYKKNAENLRSIRVKWRLANPERAKAIYDKWAAANPEVRRINNQNHRALKRSNGGKLSQGLVDNLFKLQRGKCACGCGNPLGDDFHRDHIMPLALGGPNTDDNIQLLRRTCNLQKGKRHPIEFMQTRGFLL